MTLKFINIETAYEYFYEESVDNIPYIGLLFNTLSNFYEVLFEPPKEGCYTVIKIYGTI